MNTLRSSSKIMPACLMVTFSLLLMMSLGCGASGPPIAPEEVGLEAKIRAQQQQSKSMSSANGEDLVPLEEEAVQLPDLHPVGTR